MAEPALSIVDINSPRAASRSTCGRRCGSAGATASGILATLVAVSVAAVALSIPVDAAARASRSPRLEASAQPPLPQPHPNRASASRKASTARAARGERESAAAAASRPATQSSAATPPLPVERPPQRGDGGPSSPGVGGTTSSATAAREDDAATSAPEPERPARWSDEEVSSARRECDELLASIAADAELQAPLRQGDCGTPAPLKVARIGSDGGIALEPAGILNCRMVARLHQWLETVAQPAAREELGSKIVKLSNASAYMCRNRYSDAAAKISEHAFANALDVSAFVLADGRRIDVKSFWGLPDSAQATATKLATVEAAKPPPASGNAAGPQPTPLSRKQLTPRAVTAGLTTEAPVDQATRTAPQPVTAEQKFLRRLHSSACGIFSTVLGPEANAAHHDHFHLDLQKRRSSAYCQ